MVGWREVIEYGGLTKHTITSSEVSAESPWSSVSSSSRSSSTSTGRPGSGLSFKPKSPFRTCVSKLWSCHRRQLRVLSHHICLFVFSCSACATVFWIRKAKEVKPVPSTSLSGVESERKLLLTNLNYEVPHWALIDWWARWSRTRQNPDRNQA